MYKEEELYAAFLPDEIILHSISALKNIHLATGVLMYVDVSRINACANGFYKKNICNLPGLLTCYFNTLIKVIILLGGDVLKISGTGIVAFWKSSNLKPTADEIHDVVVCANFIRANLGHFASCPDHSFGIKVAISSGDSFLTVLGDDLNRTLTVLGNPIHDAQGAMASCNEGDVCLTSDSWSCATAERYEVIAGNDENYVKILNCAPSNRNNNNLNEARECCESLFKKYQRLISNEIDEPELEMSRPLRNSFQSLAHWNPIDLRAFVAKPMLDSIDSNRNLNFAPEMRHVSVCYIQAFFLLDDEVSFVAVINEVYQTINQIIYDHSGFIYDTGTFKSAASFSVIFGAQGGKTDYTSGYALSASLELVKFLETIESVHYKSIGIAHGVAFCGAIGDDSRREFALIGSPVLKSMLMVSEFSSNVICDCTSYKFSKMPSYYFKVLPMMKNEYIFECSVKPVKLYTPLLPLIGRNVEACFVRDIVSNPEVICGYLGVCFHGADGFGKSKFILSSLVHAQDNGYSVASMELSNAVQRPYFCIAVLYKQLYDALAESASENIVNLPADIWSFNEILQDDFQNQNSFTYKKVNIINYFVEICRKGYNGISIVFVDNVQYMDLESLEILGTVLKSNCLRFIATGFFEEQHWHVQFKFSLSRYIKLLEWQPLEANDIAVLACQLLCVRGLPRDFAETLGQVCNGKSSYLQNILLKLINTQQLSLTVVDMESDTSFVFPHPKYLHVKYQQNADLFPDLVPVAQLSNANELHEFTDTYFLTLFESLTPFQKEVIQTASILGTVFTRSAVLASLTSDEGFTFAIKLLFEEGIFECGLIKMTAQSLFINKLTCLCTIDDVSSADLPKYVNCKIMYFKNDFVRNLAYGLVSRNQRGVAHMDAMATLEAENKNCPNCLKENFGPILTMRRFLDCAQLCAADSLEQVRKMTQVGAVKNRALWDSKACSCLEILVNTYSDMVIHSNIAENLNRKIFYLVELGYIHLSISEYDNALNFLKDAQELIRSYIVSNTVEEDFLKILKCRINVLLAESHIKLNRFDDAKKVLSSYLSQYLAKGSSSYSTLKRLFNKSTSHERGARVKYCNHPYFKMDLSRCMHLTSIIFAVEDLWVLARFMSLKSLVYLLDSSYDAAHSCEVFSNAIKLYSFNGDAKACRKLEKLSLGILSETTARTTVDMVALFRYMFEIFEVRFLFARQSAIEFGFKLLEMSNSVQNYYVTIKTTVILCTALLWTKKIEEAVCLARRLKHMGSLPNEVAMLAYYAFSLELNLETSFLLEKPEKCLRYAETYFAINGSKLSFNEIENKMLFLLVNYSLRKDRWPEGVKWKQMVNLKTFVLKNFLSGINWFKYTESILILMVKNREGTKSFKRLDKNLVKVSLARCDIAAKKWPVFRPRYLHFMAYYYQIKQHRKVNFYLNLAENAALINGNILEKCWIHQSKNCWNGGFSFGNELNYIDWKLAKSYFQIQWSQIMFALPYN